MNKHLFRKIVAIGMVYAVMLGPVMPSLVTKTEAAVPGNEYDPLLDWIPNNGRTFDPTAQAMQSVQGRNGSTLPQAATPVLTIGDPSPAAPNDPVDVTTGGLHFSEKDFSYPTYGPALEIARSYSTANAGKLGIFGYGWSIPQDRYLQMFSDFAITDFHGDGSSENYTYTKNDPSQVVESYDNDPLIYYPLDDGFYTAANTSNHKTLTRRGATDYLLVDPTTGMRYAFAGYKAPWRTDAPKNAGKLLRYADRTGLVLWMDYDDNGHITDFRSNTAPKLRFTYTGDQVSSVTDSGGLTYSYQYDAAHNLTQITHPDGTSVEMTYDANHHITSRTENGVKLAYDYAGDKVTAVRDAHGTALYSYRYDGNTVTRTDAEGNQTVYTIDSNNKITKRVDPNGAATSFTYDAEGHVTSLTTAAGTEKMTYDANGNLTQHVDPLGNETTITYDTTLNKPTQITEPGGATWTYTYDDKGKLTSTTDPLGRSIQNQVTPFWQVPLQSSDGSRTASYDYNNFAQLDAVTDVLGRVTKYDYDSSDRLTTITYPDGKTEQLAYDGGSRQPSRIISPNGALQQFEYQNGQLVKQVDENGQATVYHYNDLGQLDKKIQPGGAETDYAYSPMGRLASVKGPDGTTVSYTWDATGNLTQKSGTGIVPTEYQYDSSGHVIKTTTPNGTTTFERDTLGRITKKTDRSATRRPIRTTRPACCSRPKMPADRPSPTPMMLPDTC